MSKESSKKMFEWYAQVAEDKLNEKYSHIETFKDCEDETELKNWLLLVYIKHYGLRCTCDDAMDWEFHIASSHYHNCQLHKFCHAVNRSLEWAEHFNKPEVNKPSLSQNNKKEDGFPPTPKGMGIQPTIL